MANVFGKRWRGAVLGCLALMTALLAAPARAGEPWIAVVGDFGSGSIAEQQVASLVDARRPIAVLTTGDNAYHSDDYPALVGAYYCRYLGGSPPSTTCPTSAMARVNRFYPATGNHDYSDAGIDAYQAYFAAARPRTWYAVVIDGIEFLVLDTQRALDDPSSMAAQRSWLARRARASTAPWQVVILHHPPFSSSTVHGSTRAFQWPFRAWGVDLIIAGHDHDYERLRRWGATYVVNGAGGAELYPLGAPLMGSAAGTDKVHGALFLRANPRQLVAEFQATDGEVVDRFALTR